MNLALVIFAKGKSIGCTTAHCRFYPTLAEAEEFFEKLHKGRNAQLYVAFPINGWTLVKEKGSV